MLDDLPVDGRDEPDTAAITAALLSPRVNRANRPDKHAQLAARRQAFAAVFDQTIRAGQTHHANIMKRLVCIDIGARHIHCLNHFHPNCADRADHPDPAA